MKTPYEMLFCSFRHEVVPALYLGSSSKTMASITQVRTVHFADPLVSDIRTIPAEFASWEAGEIAPEPSDEDNYNAYELTDQAFAEIEAQEKRDVARLSPSEILAAARALINAPSFEEFQARQASPLYEKEIGVVLRAPVAVEEVMPTIFRGPPVLPTVRPALARRDARFARHQSHSGSSNVVAIRESLQAALARQPKLLPAADHLCAVEAEDEDE